MQFKGGSSSTAEVEFQICINVERSERNITLVRQVVLLCFFISIKAYTTLLYKGNGHYSLQNNSKYLLIQPIWAM